ncbi:unnamed protein product [Peniophora sp. CBMAI 1063]|nr:unnamed protein product [Peniophora sp. CBMAI 1063]
MDPVAFNATLPISRLLIPELFSEIIHYALAAVPPQKRYQAYDLEKRGSWSYTDPSFPILRLGAAVVASHVCHAWRVLSLGTPSFWAPYIGFIPFAGSEFLARSGQTPVDIYHDEGVDEDCWAKKAVVNTSRIRSIYVRNLSTNGISLLERTLCGRLASLEKLALEVDHKTSESQLRRLPETLVAPKLGSLRLDQIFLYPVCRNLNSLSMSSITAPMEALLEILRTNSRLSSLDLLSVDLTEINDTRRAEHRIKLPRLQRFHFYDHDGTESTNRIASHLLLNLEMSPKQFALSILEWSDELLQECLDIIYREHQPSLLWVDDDDFDFFTLPPSHPSEIPPKLDFGSGRIGILTGLSEALGPASTSLQDKNVGHITTIAIRQVDIAGTAEYYPFEEELRGLWCAFPEVETYWIKGLPSGGEYDVFLDALKPGRLYHSDEDQTPFPRLQTLGIQSKFSDPDPDLLAHIHEIIMARMEAGMPALKVVSLPNTPRPPLDDAAALRLCSSVEDMVYWKETFEERGDKIDLLAM